MESTENLFWMYEGEYQINKYKTKWNKSILGRSSKKKYRQSVKGKITAKKARQKYTDSIHHP